MPCGTFTQYLLERVCIFIPSTSMFRIGVAAIKNQCVTLKPVLNENWSVSAGVNKGVPYVVSGFHISSTINSHVGILQSSIPAYAFLSLYSDGIMGAIASQITSLAIVFSTVYSGANQRKHQSPASLAFVRGTHRWPVNPLHKWPVTRKIFPFDDVIMLSIINS